MVVLLFRDMLTGPRVWGWDTTPHEVQSGIAEPCPREELPHALVHTEGLLAGEQLFREGPGDSW